MRLKLSNSGRFYLFKNSPKHKLKNIMFCLMEVL